MKVIYLLLFFVFFFCESKFYEKPKPNKSLDISKVNELEQFLKNSKYNQQLAMFIDFSISSGKYRFFVYDFKNKRVIEKGIVSHGSGSVIPNSKKLRFSNTEGSYQSSLGKYCIQNSYVGQFGKSYRLKGLDATNSNALKRAIVLHSYSCVPDSESESDVCLSLGCPMISPRFFQTVSRYIDQSEKPIVLFTFY